MAGGSAPAATTGGGSRREIILCISTYEKGQAFMRQAAAMGCRVVLLTVNSLQNADWPRDVLDEIHTMPDGLSREQITNTACTWTVCPHPGC
jgi:hypothetical protein